MAIISGQRGTGTQVSGLQKVDFHNEILELEPNAAPLTQLTGKIGSVATHNPEFKWAEATLQSRVDAVNNGAGYNTSDTSIVVDDGTKFYDDALVKVTRTGEVMRVTGVSTNTLTVVRGLGNSGTGVAIVDNDEVLVIGSAQEEGADINPARSENAAITTNYTQIFRTPWSSTETNRNTDLYVNTSDWAFAGKHAGIEHKKDLELSFWFGEPDSNTSGSHPRRTTGGVLNYVTTNTTAAGGTMSETEFFGAMRQAARYNSAGQWTLFCSLLVADVLNTFATSKLQAVQADADKTYGLNVSRFVSPHGVCNVVPHPLFTDSSAYGGYAVGLDMSQVRKRHLQNRDTHIVVNRQGPGVDGRTDELVTEAGLQFGLQKRHFVITGITG